MCRNRWAAHGVCLDLNEFAVGRKSHRWRASFIIGVVSTVAMPLAGVS